MSRKAMYSLTEYFSSEYTVPKKKNRINRAWTATKSVWQMANAQGRVDREGGERRGACQCQFEYETATMAERRRERKEDTPDEKKGRRGD